MARKLPESLHVALIMGSKGLSNLLKQKIARRPGTTSCQPAAAEQAGSHIYPTISRYFLGQWHFLLGEFPEALSHFEAALAISEQTAGETSSNPACCFGRPRPRRGSGFTMRRSSTSAATSTSSNGVGSIEGLAWFPSRGVAHRIRGLLLAKQKAFADASDEFARSLELLRGPRLQARPSSHARRRWASASSSAAGRCEARQAFETAATCFREMGFTFELQQTLRLLEGA